MWIPSGTSVCWTRMPARARAEISNRSRLRRSTADRPHVIYNRIAAINDAAGHRQLVKLVIGLRGPELIVWKRPLIRMIEKETGHIVTADPAPIDHNILNARVAQKSDIIERKARLFKHVLDIVTPEQHVLIAIGQQE